MIWLISNLHFLVRFKLNCDGPVDANISVSFSIKDGNKRPQSPIIKDGEFVERENYFLPQPTYILI